MRMIIGLGNPGKKYEHTKHNVGFDTVDLLANKLGCRFKKSIRLSGEVAKGGNYVLLKPTTYMNLSGDSIVKAMKYYKVDVDDILVIYDDIDLPVGKLRIRPGGGAGGHNGIKSIIKHLGEQFQRFRIGVGRRENLPTAHDVLNKFSKEDRKIIEDVINKAVDASIEYVEGATINQIMNKYN